MESLYSKLYEKYTKLKARRFEGLEKLNKEQDLTYKTHVTAAEELIEHLRSEKDRLSEQVNGLRNEIDSLRAKEYEQSLEYQDLLMEDNLKIKELKERLLQLQREGIFPNAKDGDMPMLNVHVDNQNGSENTPIRSNNTTKTLFLSNSAFVADRIEHPDPATAGHFGKKSTSKQPSACLQLPECCREINNSSEGGGTNKIESANCVYHILIESLVDLKLSASNQLPGLSISALHESSGYTFSLTRVYNAGQKETELLYKVISLGTLARIAPKWMREEIMFNINMCPLFFERISRFIRLNQ